MHYAAAIAAYITAALLVAMVFGAVAHHGASAPFPYRRDGALDHKK